MAKCWSHSPVRYGGIDYIAHSRCGHKMAQYSGVKAVLGSLEGEWLIMENNRIIVFVASLQITEGTNVVPSGPPRSQMQWNAGIMQLESIA